MINVTNQNTSRQFRLKYKSLNFFWPIISKWKKEEYAVQLLYVTKWRFIVTIFGAKNCQ